MQRVAAVLCDRSQKGLDHGLGLLLGLGQDVGLRGLGLGVLHGIVHGLYRVLPVGPVEESKLLIVELQGVRVDGDVLDGRLREGNADITAADLHLGVLKVDARTDLGVVDHGKSLFIDEGDVTPPRI